jgi:GNAT superfamily N-acetyltransferase
MPWDEPEPPDPSAMRPHVAGVTPEITAPDPLRLVRLRNNGLIALRLDEPPTIDELRAVMRQATFTAQRPWYEAPRMAMGNPTLPRELARRDATLGLAIEAATGEPVGAIACAPERGALADGWVHVRPAWRGLGLGIALLEWLAERARADGYAWLGASMGVTDGRMLSLVRRLGVVTRATGREGTHSLLAPVPAVEDGPGIALGAVLWCAARGGMRALS